MPRWVKAAIAVVLVMVVVLIISKLAGVDHGVGLHSGNGRTPVPRVSVDGATPRAGAKGHPLPAGVDRGQP